MELTDGSFGKLASRLSDLADETTATLKEQVLRPFPSRARAHAAATTL